MVSARFTCVVHQWRPALCCESWLRWGPNDLAVYRIYGPGLQAPLSVVAMATVEPTASNHEGPLKCVKHIMAATRKPERTLFLFLVWALLRIQAQSNNKCCGTRQFLTPSGQDLQSLTDMSCYRNMMSGNSQTSCSQLEMFRRAGWVTQHQKSCHICGLKVEIPIRRKGRSLCYCSCHQSISWLATSLMQIFLPYSYSSEGTETFILHLRWLSLNTIMRRAHLICPVSC